MKTPTTLTFWTWVPNISQEVAVFEKAYPAIKVNVVNAGQGEPEYTKLRTALTAAKGAPDLAQIEYREVPSFTITNSLVDLRPYGAAANSSKFVDRVGRGDLGLPAGHRAHGDAVPGGHLRRTRDHRAHHLGRWRDSLSRAAQPMTSSTRGRSGSSATR